METQKEILQRKLQQAVKRKNFVEIARITSELEKIKQVEHVAVRDMFGEMTPEQKSKAVKECRKIPLFADLLAQSAIDLTNVLHKVDKNCSLPLMQDVDRCRFYAEKIVKIVDNLGDEEFSESFGELADLVSEKIDNLIEESLE